MLATLAKSLLHPNRIAAVRGGELSGPANGRGRALFELSILQLRRGLAWRARGGKNDDFIDVDTGISAPRQSGGGGGKNPNDGKDKGFLSGIFNGLAKLVGQDEASLAKKKARKQVNTAIDQMLAGTGVAGGLFGSLIKGVAGMVADGLAEQQAGMQSVNDMVIQALEDDEECAAALGKGIKILSVFSSSSSSSSLNGVMVKQISLGLMVSGSSDSATVQASASAGGGGDLGLNDLTLQLQSSGRVIRVNRGRGGGRGSGSGTGSGGVYNSPGRGRVIDVKGEVV